MYPGGPGPAVRARAGPRPREGRRSPGRYRTRTGRPRPPRAYGDCVDAALAEAAPLYWLWFEYMPLGTVLPDVDLSSLQPVDIPMAPTTARAITSLRVIRCSLRVWVEGRPHDLPYPIPVPIDGSRFCGRCWCPTPRVWTVDLGITCSTVLQNVRTVCRTVPPKQLATGGDGVWVCWDRGRPGRGPGPPPDVTTNRGRALGRWSTSCWRAGVGKARLRPSPTPGLGRSLALPAGPSVVSTVTND